MPLGAVLGGIGAILGAAGQIGGLFGRRKAAEAQRDLAKKTARYQYDTDMQAVEQLKKEGRTFISGQQVGSALTGASGGSITGALQESERQLGEDVRLSKEDANKRLELGLEGADVDYQSNRPGFFDYASAVGSFATNVAPFAGNLGLGQGIAGRRLKRQMQRAAGAGTWETAY